MADKVFYSYRHEDSGDETRLLRKALRQRLRRVSYFIDQDLSQGTNFAQVLSDQVLSADVLVCVIGSKWLDIRDQQNKRRLENPTDLVRDELFSALLKGVEVFPVLLEDTAMPAERDLPPVLAMLPHKHARRLRKETYNEDVDAIAADIRRLFSSRRATGRRHAFLVSLAAAAAFGMGAWAGPVMHENAGTAPWVDIGIIKRFGQANDFLYGTNENHFVRSLQQTTSEVWFVGTAFYIVLENYPDMIFERIKSGIRMNFAVLDPRSAGLEPSVRALRSNVIDLRGQCETGIRALVQLKARLAELGPEYSERLQVRLSPDMMQMRGYFFDPEQPAALSYIIPQINFRSSQWLPGYLARRREGAEPSPYYIGARDYWSSGLLVTLEDWLKKHEDQP